MEDTRRKMNLRDLDDTDCTSVVVAKRILRMIHKFPELKTCSIDCFAQGMHFITFTLGNKEFIWITDDGKQFTSKDDLLTHEYLNKLIVDTFRTMCDSQDSEDLSDTPEDLLAFAETKLQEMLHDENSNKADDSSDLLVN